MNKEWNLNLDPLQLQQMIIFLKSEIAKYKNEVAQLKNNDYYSLSLTFEQENLQLKEQIRELSKQILIIERTYQKEIASFQIEAQTYEHKRAKLNNSIQRLVAEKEQLKTTNQQLQNALKETQHLKKTSEYYYLESFEKTFPNFIQQTYDQFQSIQSQLNNHLEEVLTAKKDILENLKQEGEQIKHLLNELNITNKDVIGIQERDNENLSTLPDLEEKMKIVYSKTKLFEQQLEEKLQMLHTFEKQFNELTNDSSQNTEIKTTQD